ncbi:MAG: SDR family NAD(P)-dependent oxidoreductase [Gemmatimonadota bacterium]
MTELTGKVAVVTGANRGIGKGIALALARAGAHVVVAARTADALEAAARELRGQAAGGEVLPVATDVTDEAQVRVLFARADELGGPDILVNNAGAFDGGPLEDLSLEAWNRVIGACLTGAFLCTREAFRRMKPRGRGRILNIGSISAQRSRANMAPYTAAKFGLWGLTQAAALEGREHGIAVSCLHPGNVLVERRQGSGRDSDVEPMMSVEVIAATALHMLALPPHVNLLEAIVLPNQQLYLGRG